MLASKFGIYIHIPYCLQRCSYCDFATYVYDQILPPEEYLELLSKEIHLRKDLFLGQPLTSIYFGGGTPSLLSSENILSVLDALEKNNLSRNESTEVTLEINPATLDQDKIKSLIEGGVNRFSVGAQSFNDLHLKAAGRKHNSKDTRQTLDLLQKKEVNYSFDLLFALPNQTIQELKEDLKIIADYSPPHLSAYCLTVPEGHPMSFNRPEDQKQVEMFQLIEEELKRIGILRYEISNFAKPGFESQHNLLYWKDENYIGFGLSAHSSLKTHSEWGQRFWNPSSIDQYKKAIDEPASNESLDDLEKRSCIETLSEKQALFDFCHTSLRLDEGFLEKDLRNRFREDLVVEIRKQLDSLKEKNLVLNEKDSWRLSSQGVLLSNHVFSELLV